MADYSVSMTYSLPRAVLQYTLSDFIRADITRADIMMGMTATKLTTVDCLTVNCVITYTEFNLSVY